MTPRGGEWTSTDMPLGTVPASDPPTAEAPTLSIFEEITQLAGVQPKAKAPGTATKAGDDPNAGDATSQPSPPATVSPQPGDKPSPRSGKDIRQELDNLRREREALIKERDALKATDPKAAEDYKLLAAELETLRKTKADLETRLAFTDYEQSPEYQRAYAKPLDDALQTAYADMAELTVTSDEGARPATATDFNQLLRLPLQQAIKAAHETFGDAAPHVLTLRRQVMDLNTRRQKALDDFKTGAEQRKLQRAQADAAIKAAWETHLSTRATEFPQLYAPDEADPTGNQLLEKGQRLADAAFFPPEGSTPQDLVAIRAEVRMRAAAFGRLVHRNTALESQVKALTDELARYKASEPGSGQPGNQPASQATDWRDELRSLARG